MMGRKRLSQSELARRIGVSQQAISRLSSGEVTGSRHLHRIARELGTTPAYLSGETDDPDANAPPEPELTPEEARMLTLFRQLQQDDRAALKRVAERMVGPRTIHSPRLSYRAGDDN